MEILLICCLAIMIAVYGELSARSAHQDIEIATLTDRLNIAECAVIQLQEYAIQKLEKTEQGPHYNDVGVYRFYLN